MHTGHNNPRHEYQMNGGTLKNTSEENDLGVWIQDDLEVVAKQCAEAMKKANQTLAMVKRSFRYRYPEIIISHSSGHILITASKLGDRTS